MLRRDLAERRMVPRGAPPPGLLAYSSFNHTKKRTSWSRSSEVSGGSVVKKSGSFWNEVR